MNKIHIKYMNNKNKENWRNIINEEKSLTKKLLTKYLINSTYNFNFKIDETFLDKIFITNAIMCTRKGENYRGDTIKLEESTSNCTGYIKRQINIVKPKVILTLGFYPLYSLSKIYNFNIEKTLSENIEGENNEIRINNFTIIPLYHPVAQISRERQLIQYNKVWKYIE